VATGSIKLGPRLAHHVFMGEQHVVAGGNFLPAPRHFLEPRGAGLSVAGTFVEAENQLLGQLGSGRAIEAQGIGDNFLARAVIKGSAA